MNLMNIILNKKAECKNIAGSLHLKKVQNRQTNIWCFTPDGSYLWGGG